MRLRLLVLVISLISGACATRGEPGSQSDVTVLINNNLIPPASLTIYLVPRAGIERNLGNLVGSGRHTLHYRGFPLGGEYQLIARTTGDRAFGSPVMVLDNVSRIDWDLQRNFVDITYRDE